MSEYLVSARKYRPDSFETLIGQDNIARTLKNSIQRGQLAHAYLFCGPRGVGKTTTARIFAKAINCQHPSPQMDPCGQCESCLAFAEGRSYCIHELDAASNNGVEDIKTLMDKVQIPPQIGRYSVYIIDEVHMLSTSAFNAFLKTLEEPPSHAIFILCTTEKHKILPTILSRCQTYDFNRISIPDICRNLREIASKEGIGVDDESLHIIARKADGAMRDALTIFDQTVAFCGQDVKYESVIANLNVLDYEYSFRIVEAALSGDYAAALLIFDEILSKGFNAQYFISSLAEHFRDLLVSRTGGLDCLLDFPVSLKERYAAQALKCSAKFLFDAIAAAKECEAGYKSSTNQRLHVEFALMKICFQTTAPSPAPAPSPAAPSPAPAISAPKPAASAFSLSSITAAASKQTTASVEVQAASSDAQPQDEDLLEAWRKVASSQIQPRLRSALVAAKIGIVSSAGVKILDFSVTNEAQKTWIEEKILRTLETDIRSALKTSAVRLSVSVVPAGEEQEIKYMPADKAKAIMEENPSVREFVMNLELDTK